MLQYSDLRIAQHVVTPRRSVVWPGHLMVDTWPVVVMTMTLLQYRTVHCTTVVVVTIWTGVTTVAETVAAWSQ